MKSSIPETNSSPVLHTASAMPSTPFYAEAKGYLYDKPVHSLADGLEVTSRIYLPVETDTEFYHYPSDLDHPSQLITSCLTIQHRAIAFEEGLIFTHSDSHQIARHPVIKTGFSPIDYLNNIGYRASIRRTNNPIDLPVMQVDIYGFFLVAELYRIVSGEYQDDVNKLVLRRRDDNTSIAMGRRLIASTVNTGSRAEQFVMMPWIASIDGLEFQIAISYYDCCAVQGIANYAAFCSNSGVKLKYKDTFTSEEKGMMREQYINRQDDFDKYSLGDLYCYLALIGNMKNFKLVYQSLGISDFFEPPRLTIGATVARIVRSSLLSYLGLTIKDKNRVIEVCKFGTSAHIKTLKTTGVYNAKVDGGRCRNARPIDASIHKPLADADISGCYGNGLKHQDFPIGRPVIIDYDITSQNNQYQTLREFLKDYRKELVPGLWQARVSTKKGYTLNYPQDYLVSWIPPKDPSKIPTDTHLQEIEWYDEDNIGITKIFTHEINLALINQEFLDWLENTASNRQKKELLDNLEVITALYYPSSERCKTPEEFFLAVAQHKGRNNTKAVHKRGRTKKITIAQECHAWLSVNLGTLLVTNLLLERKKYNKDNPEEQPLNELYKLCINTIYGDMVSPFFDIGNTCVGNNITARARSVAWYMEKGLNGFQTITDGCCFELNRVIHEDSRRVTASAVLTPYLSTSDANYTLKPIGGADKIETYNDNGKLGLMITYKGEKKVLDNSKAKNWLAESIEKHLKSVFPKIPVLDKFSFEIKGIWDAVALHGTANYKFSSNQIAETGKMRSYSKKYGYKSYHLAGDDLQLINHEYRPSEEFLESILRNPQTVPRSHTYIASKILKTGEYKAHYESRWGKSKAFPGCSVESARLLRECSLTQFTFQSPTQFKSWEREAKRLRDLTGQTFETWFMNPDGTLNFQEMIITLESLIRKGKPRFTSTRKSNEQRNLSREYKNHPAYETLTHCKYQLGLRYNFLSDESDELFLEIGDDVICQED